MYYVEVAPMKIVRANAPSFTYHAAIPLVPGSFVTIPIGKTTQTGIVIATTRQPTYTTKPVSEHLALIPTLPFALLQTALWMSEYYQTHLATVLTTIIPRGITKQRRAIQTASSIPSRDRTHFLLNKLQVDALATIGSATPGTILLHGITGSGKTAVYIEYAKRCIADGQSVIILVPEIALTSQLVADFTTHFENVIVTHSGQTESQRHQVWQLVAETTTPHIVIGPRSALFMPVRSLGAIIIDEAHEPSFKQDQSPRYSALRVASVLAKHHQAKVVQGSATPLVSEYYLATKANRPIIHLHERARSNAIPPQTALIDMTKKSHFTRHRLFSNELLTMIQTALDNGHQALIYHNRRGSASTTLCDNCGWSAICPRCFVPYTLHADLHTLRCHICGQKERVPTSCPDCHSTDIIHKGIGTKLIESELKKLFKSATIARFDGDAVNGATLDKRYQELYDGKINLIIGTQVVAKGLDLPKLRVVGVVQADAGLSLPDYTSSERTFQLLAQVVGRVGRSEHATSLVVQTFQPDHYAVRLGIAQNFHAFYEYIIAERRRAHFPPFVYLLRLTTVYKTEAATVRNAQLVAGEIRRAFPDLEILGPTPSFYERQHDTYRWQIVIKSPKRARLIEALQLVPPTNWQSDLDPMSLL